MAKAQRYTKDQIELARKKLRELTAKKVGKTRAEVTALLAADIQKATQQGYSLPEIRDILSQAGISVSLARMRVLLEEATEKGQGPGEMGKDTATSAITSEQTEHSENEAIVQPSPKQEVEL